ncbi:MAG: cold-shock protein [Kiloniellaceae bacterium]
MMDNESSEQSEITHREITAVVKWFNPAKGFGFVQPSDGSPDAFMHVSVVARSGHRHLPQGATIVCDLCAGPKGPQVAAVHRVEALPEMPVGPHEGETAEIEGTVKFYNREKGFGFVVPDDGGKDVFVSARVLERAGMQNLGPDQRVRMLTRMGHKGPMADSIEII